MKYRISLIQCNNNKTRNIFWHFYSRKRLVIYFVIIVKCLWCVQIKNYVVCCNYISTFFYLFLRSGAAWNVWHRKKNYDVCCFFFNKENVNVCPSFRPYCMTDWFYIRWEKKTPPRRRKKWKHGRWEQHGVLHAADERLQTTCMGWQRAETLIFHQPSPHTRIAEVSNNTKGLFYLYTEQNK